MKRNHALKHFVKIIIKRLTLIEFGFSDKSLSILIQKAETNTFEIVVNKDRRIHLTIQERQVIQERNIIKRNIFKRDIFNKRKV
jgi:hypothetical protein